MFQPFYGGKKNRVTAQIFDPTEKKPFVNIEGEWNGVMYAKHNTGVSRFEIYILTRVWQCLCFVSLFMNWSGRMF